MSAFGYGSFLSLILCTCIMFVTNAVTAATGGGGPGWLTTTACYGADQRCSRYRMQCEPHEAVRLGSLMYATKPDDPDCQFGISDCTADNKKCCEYSVDDIFTPFSRTDESSVMGNCSGRVSCMGWAPRLATTPYSQYAVFNYTCVAGGGVLEICTEGMQTEKTHFLRFNVSNVQVSKFSVDTNECYCSVHAHSCGSQLKIYSTDLRFQRPSSPFNGCSSAFILEGVTNKSIDCRTSVGTELTIPSSTDVLSLRNLYKFGNSDVPGFILLRIVAWPPSPATIQCGPPGSIPTTYNACSSSTANNVYTTATVLSSPPSTQSHGIESSSRTYTTTTPFSTPSTSSTAKSPHTTIMLSTRASTSTSASTTSVLSSNQQSANIASLPAATSKISIQSTVSTLFSLKQFNLSRGPMSLTSTNKASPTATTNKLTKTQSPPSDRQSVSPFPYSAPLSPLTSAITRTDKTTGSAGTATELTTDKDTSSSTIAARISVSVTGGTRLSTLLPTVPPNATSVSPAGATPKSVILYHTVYTKFAAGQTPPKIDIAASASHVSTEMFHDISVTNMSPRSVAQSVRAASTTGRSTDVGRPHPGNATERNHTGNTTDRHTDSSSDVITTIGLLPPVDDDGDVNKALVIGVSIGAVVVVAVTAAVVSCLCIRGNRKEKVKRNYIRNTNICYGFADEHDGVGSMNSVVAHTLNTVESNRHYDSIGEDSAANAMKNSSSSEYYNIEQPDRSTGTPANDLYPALPRDDSTETSEETIEFINDEEDIPDDEPQEPHSGTATRVKFDPSSLYSQVHNERKTKF